MHLNCKMEDKDVFQKLMIKVRKGSLNKISLVVVVDDQGLRFTMEIVVMASIPGTERPPTGAFPCGVSREMLEGREVRYDVQKDSEGEGGKIQTVSDSAQSDYASNSNLNQV